MKTSTTPTAYSYLRYSTPEQSRGDSIRRQTEATAEWCARNGVTLDTTLRDDGISAFKGKHRSAENADTRALAGFLAAVKSGKVAVGSYLILESLDRLTREDIVPAVNLFTGLLMAGVKIVQIHPTEHVYTMGADMTAVMLALVELSRGNSESKMKSERVGKAWAAKIRGAASGTVTARVPTWIDYDPATDTMTLNAAKTATVRRIYALAADGYSAVAIAKRLNADRVPPMGRSVMRGRPVAWTASTIRHIVTTRAAVGEYTPYAGYAAKPTGEPIPGYYPAAVDEATYYAAQAAIKTRATVGRGRKGKHVNLLAGLLIDARSVSPMTYQHTATGCTVVTHSAGEGAPVPWSSFPAKELESALLSKLKELTPRDVTGDDTDTDERLKAADADIARIDALRSAWRAKMDDVRIIDTVATKLAELDAERSAANQEREAARREAAAPAADALGAVVTLADLLATDNSDEMRTRVRAAIRGAVESVHIIVADGHKKVRRAAVRVQFRGGGHRDYVVIVWTAHAPRPAVWAAESAKWPTRGKEIDIRNPADAAAVAKVLAKLDVPSRPDRPTR